VAANVKRQTSLSLKLGGEKLTLVSLDAHEGMSERFVISLDVLAKVEIKLLDNLGKAASISASLDGELQRYFNGVVIDGRYIEEVHGEGHLYRLTLAPSSYFHEQGSNFCIYQGKTVIAIVEEVLERCKIPFKVVASGGKRTLAYCVQYGESDFAFVCRLLEEDGLYYYYQHEASAHRMMICDKPSSHPQMPAGKLHFNPLSDSVGIADSSQRAGLRAFVQAWHEHASSGAEAKVTMHDYDFTKSDRPRKATVEEHKAHDEDAIEVYRWPGRFYEEADGKALSHVLLESRRAQRLRYEGSSQFAGIQPGYTFALDRHPNDRFNRKYLITNCRTHLASEHYRSSMGSGEAQVEFLAIPDDVQFRAPIVTPRPVAKGPETAVVTGPAGEEIHVDEFGRIKVQFHWDRKGELNDKSSCWLRVSQTGGLGNIIIPRIGHEVLVDFINGNPDRPIVVGRVFNAGHKPVYPLPANKTKALWRTKTYKQDTGSDLSDAEKLDTGKPGANEVRFEDATGKEEVFIHAERDMNTRIRHDESHHVGKDVMIKVGKNRTEEVGENEKITIKKNREEEVMGTETVTVTKDRKVKIDSNDSLTVAKSITIDAGTEITITAKSKITLKVGKSTFVLDPASIKLATGILDMAAKGTADLSSTKTNIEGKAALIAKGGMVMIN
jgi:type VI secretion system secreted protein VgrG